MSKRAAIAHIYTIGHSTRSQEEFLSLLKEFEIATLADVRSLPGSRKFPHFGRENLEQVLPLAGIRYAWLKSLGGRRRSPKGFESPNTGLTSPAFRSYADYMATDEFAAGIDELLNLAKDSRTAIMCAEAVFWRCHRRLISDYLTMLGVEVVHIFGPHQSRPHAMTPEARRRRGKLVYPAVTTNLRRRGPSNSQK